MQTISYNELAQQNIDAVIIPQIFRDRFRLANGEPDLTTIFLLSEIIYGYSAKAIVDPKTGEVIGTEPRFKGDYLQKEYQSFIDKFDCSETEIKTSFERLENIGVVKRIFRTHGMFIALDTDKLSELLHKY